MNCENCDRNNVIKSYCYFSRNKILFEYATGTELTLDSFVMYATEMELVWRISVCPYVPRTELVMYWKILEPLLIEALQRKKSGELPETSKIDIDWLSLIFDSRNTK